MSLAGRSLNAKLRPATTPGVWQRLELRARPAELGESSPGGAGESLWPALDRRLAAAGPCPRLRPGLALKPLPAGRGAGLLLADPAAGRVYRLGEREAGLLRLMDGSRDLAALAAGAAPLGVPAVEQFVHDLRLAGLLDERAGLWQRLAAPRSRGPLLVWAPAGAEAALAALHARLRFLFRPAALAALALLPLAAAASLIARWPQARAGVAALAADPWPWLPLLLLVAYLATLPAVLLHELAHALACIHLGGRVGRLGLMVSRLLPAAFADVSDVYFMPRRARIAVYLAGPASTLLWAALAACAWAWAPPGSPGQSVAAAMAAMAALAVATGLNPAAGQDGSEALGEWLGLPDARRQAAAYWRARLKGRAAGGTPAGRAARTFGLICLAYNAAALAAAGAALAALLV